MCVSVYVCVCVCVYVLVAQLCPTLCDPMDYGPPGSSVQGLLQERILEWIAISFSSEEAEMWKKPASFSPVPEECNNSGVL